MTYFLISLISALFVTSGFPVHSPRAGDQSDIPAEENAIYAAVIGDMFAGDKVSFDTQSKVKMLVIESRTVSYLFATAHAHNEGERIKKQFPSLSQEIIDDFAAKNARSHQLTKSFDLKLNYIIVPKERIEQMVMSRPDGWDEFYRQFPDSGGFIALSRAGINPSGNQALVYFQHSCGMVCGSGHYLLLVKGAQGWGVQKRSCY